MKQKIIHTRDFFPPSHDALDEGSEWISEQVQKKGRVYVHCKSGIGRSASMVVAYLIRYRGMPAHAAAAYVREKRPVIFSPSSPQMANLVLYEAHKKQEGTNNASMKNV